MRFTHLDYAEEAESAERGNSWPQATALWSLAAMTCPPADEASVRRYRASAERCERQAKESPRCPYCGIICLWKDDAINGLRPMDGPGCEFCDPSAEGGA